MARYILAWAPMVLIGIVNGIAREALYRDRLGEPLAHQVSTATAIALLGPYIWGVNRLWPFRSAGQAIGVGLLWLGLTVAFEFIFGHFVMRQPWSRLLADYNVLKGRLWPLVLLWIAAAPSLVYRAASSPHQPIRQSEML